MTNIILKPVQLTISATIRDALNHLYEAETEEDLIRVLLAVFEAAEAQHGGARTVYGTLTWQDVLVDIIKQELSSGL